MVEILEMTKAKFAGTLFMDGKNVLLGGEYRFGNVKSNKIEAKIT